MAEYIEREALLEKVRELSNTYSYCGLASVHMIKAIEDAPTADVVEVVRCKDCKHRYTPHNCALWYGYCNGSHYLIERGNDFYCSYGKRKEGAEE